MFKNELDNTFLYPNLLESTYFFYISLWNPIFYIKLIVFIQVGKSAKCLFDGVVCAVQFFWIQKGRDLITALTDSTDRDRIISRILTLKYYIFSLASHIMDRLGILAHLAIPSLPQMRDNKALREMTMGKGASLRRTT